MKNPWCWCLLVLALGYVFVSSAQAAEFVGRTYELSDLRDDKSRPGPILVALHADGVTAKRFRGNSGLNGAARALGAAVFYPQDADGTWDATSRDSADVTYLKRFIRAIQASPQTRDAPILLVGHGAGGAMALRLSCESPNLIAGVGIVATKMPRDLRCRGARPMPALFVHGTADPVQDHDGGEAHLPASETVAFWTRRNRCSADARIRRTDDNRRDKTSVVTRRYTKCQAAFDHIVILGGGHGWPTGRAGSGGAFGPQSGEIDASETVVRFLAPLVTR